MQFPNQTHAKLTLLGKMIQKICFYSSYETILLFIYVKIFCADEYEQERLD